MQTISARKPSTSAAIATGKVSSRVAARTSPSPAPVSRVETCFITPLLSVLRPRCIKVRYLLKQLEACIDLFARHVLQALRAKPFYRERAHHAAIEHGLAKDRGRQLRL